MADASDEDDISLTSTVLSDQVSEYDVETILADRQTATGVSYLVKWENYPIERCTWETADAFCTEETLIDWGKKKQAIADGKRKAFDVRRWDDHLASIEKKKAERKRRRAAKRQRLNQKHLDSRRPRRDDSSKDSSKKLRIDTSVVRSTARGEIRSATTVSAQGQFTRSNVSPGTIHSNPSQNASPNPHTSRASSPKNDRGKPASQKLPPILFGTQQVHQPSRITKSIESARQRKQSAPDSAPSIFKPFNFSTKRRYEKAKNYDPIPDISQLNLVRPSDWPPRAGTGVAKMGDYVVSPSTASSAVASPVEKEKATSATEKQPTFNPPVRPRYDSWRPDNGQSSPSNGQYCPDSGVRGLSKNKTDNLSRDQGSALRQLPSMPPRIPKEGCYWTRDRSRFWNPNEVLAFMSYGAERKEIGAVRMCDLNPVAKGILLHEGKVHTPRRVRIWFKYLCTEGDYRSLCNQVESSRLVSNGWVEGYNDTELAVYKMGNELRIKNLIAIGFLETAPNHALFAYSPDSTEFNFFHQDLRFSDTYLVLAMESYSPPIESLILSQQRQQTASRSQTGNPRAMVTDSSLGTGRGRRPVSPTGTHTTTNHDAGKQQVQQDKQGVASQEHGMTIKGIGAMRKPAGLGSQQTTAESNPVSPLVSKDRLQPFTTVPDTTSKPPARISQNTLSVENPTPSDKPGLREEPPTNTRPLEASKSTALNRATNTELPTTADSLTPAEDSHPTEDPSCVIDEASAVDKSHSVKKPSTLKPPPPAEPASPVEMSSSVGDFNIDTLFKQNFGVTFADLAAVNGASKHAEAFFLMFPLGDQDVQNECEVVKEFLKKHDAVIFSNRVPEDWDRFIKITSINRGVVLCHESFTAYHCMPSFSEAIRKGFIFWTVSLTQQLQFSRKPAYFEHIFPHGGVILITEDFLVRDPDATLIILAWFHEWTKKKLPGVWKIMVRPGILDFLLAQPDPTDKTRHGVWIAMYGLILQLINRGADLADDDVLDGVSDHFSTTNIISPVQIPLYGSRPEEDHPDIPRGLTQEQRNADHLVEFFAGWGLVNNHRFRKFIVLTSIRTPPRWAAWNHLDLYRGAREFFSAYNIDYKHFWNQIKCPPKSTPSSSAAASPTPFTPRTPKAPAATTNESGASKSKTSHPPSTVSKRTYYQPYQ